MTPLGTNSSSIHQFIDDPPLKFIDENSSIHQFINDPPPKVHRRNFINSSIHHDPLISVHRRNFGLTPYVQPRTSPIKRVEFAQEM